MTSSVTIIIPTRNRASLAIAAIRSLRAIAHPRLACILVSNNSSEPAQARALAQFCESSGDGRLIHVAPPRALGMADHWDWATQQALERSATSHFALHYDRRISLPDFGVALDLTARRPEQPITYLLDILYPSLGRYFVRQTPWSGGLFEIATRRALDLASQGLLAGLWQAFPVLLNCLTPRSVLERVRDRFGSICASTSPESCFGFRFAAVAESYLHFDRALGIHYGYEDSNGMGYIRGDVSGTFGDFMRLHGDRPWLDAAPIPGLSLGQNSFYHEYGLVQREAGSARFPPIDRAGYLADIAAGLTWIEDPDRRARAEEVLRREGWQGSAGPAIPSIPPPAPFATRARRWRADHLRVLVDDISTTGLKRERRALHWAQRLRVPRTVGGQLQPLNPRPLDGSAA
jgi:hypothetical protein